MAYGLDCCNFFPRFSLFPEIFQFALSKFNFEANFYFVHELFSSVSQFFPRRVWTSRLWSHFFFRARTLFLAFYHFFRRDLKFWTRMTILAAHFEISLLGFVAYFRKFLKFPSRNTPLKSYFSWANIFLIFQFFSRRVCSPVEIHLWSYFFFVRELYSGQFECTLGDTFCFLLYISVTMGSKNKDGPFYLRETWVAYHFPIRSPK